MLKAKDVKKFAKACGADICRIGSMDNWEGAPKQMDPRYIFPDAKSIIGLGFRIPRGYLRGIEEGTMFSTYEFMGYSGMNWRYMPHVLRQIVCLSKITVMKRFRCPTGMPSVTTDTPIIRAKRKSSGADRSHRACPVRTSPSVSGWRRRFPTSVRSAGAK